MENDIKEELRKRYLTNLVTEAVVVALWEQDQAQQQLPPPPPSASAPPTAQEQQSMSAPAPENQTPPVQPPPQITAEQITLDTLIERLNIIRGGKSFTDPEVYGQMTTYFKGLQPQEKDSIYKFLVQVAKIVTSNTQEQTGQVDQTSQQSEQVPEQTPPAPITPQQPPMAAPAPQQQTAPIQAV